MPLSPPLYVQTASFHHKTDSKAAVKYKTNKQNLTKQGNGALQSPPPGTPTHLGQDGINQGRYPAHDDAMTSLAAVVSIVFHVVNYVQI